jgi:MoaA/NifB/PqqE/SkfB family radical SAM enzyme
MNLNPDGAVTLCCQSHEQIVDGDGRALNAQTHSLDSIWNSPGMVDIRRRMLAGEELKHCDACFHNERYGRPSYRTYSNQRWLEGARGDEVRTLMEQPPEAHAASPMYLDLRLGNLCNLKCTACKPLYSSQIERDTAHAPWTLNAPYTRHPSRFPESEEWSTAPELLDEVISVSDNVSLIQLAGGEPTVNRTQIGLLKHLVDSGRAENIDLELVTNLSNVRPDVFALLAKFRNLTVTLSVDGTGAVYEYVRFPGKWAMLTRNVARLRQTRADSRITLNAVLQAVNATNIVDLLDWADEEEIPVNLSIGRGLDDYNDFRILPAALRVRVRRQFDDYFVRKSNQERSALRAQVDSIFAEMDETDFSEEERGPKVANLMQFINDLDSTRKLSFQAVAPEIHQGLRDYHGQWDARTRYAPAAA